MTAIQAIKTAAIAGICLSLSGCFAYQQDVSVKANGEMVLTIKIRVLASLLAMSASNGSDTFCKNSVNAASQFNITATIERYSEDGDEICKVTATGQIGDFIAAGDFSAELVDSASNDDEPPPFEYSLTRNGDTFRFNVSGQPEATPPPEESAAQFQAMAQAMVAGRSLDWSISAPNIVSTTGRLSEDGNTATYSYAVATMLSENPLPIEFTTDFTLSTGGPLDWISDLFN